MIHHDRTKREEKKLHWTVQCLCLHIHNIWRICKKKKKNLLVTSVEVRGFLFARTTQQPKSTALINISIVSMLAEQSTTANPIANTWLVSIRSYLSPTDFERFKILTATVVVQPYVWYKPVDLPRSFAISSVSLLDSESLNTWYPPFSATETRIIIRFKIHKQSDRTKSYLKHPTWIMKNQLIWYGKLLIAVHHSVLLWAHPLKQLRIYYHILQPLVNELPIKRKIDEFVS